MSPLPAHPCSRDGEHGLFLRLDRFFLLLPAYALSLTCSHTPATSHLHPLVAQHTHLPSQATSHMHTCAHTPPTRHVSHTSSHTCLSHTSSHTPCLTHTSLCTPCLLHTHTHTHILPHSTSYTHTNTPLLVQPALFEFTHLCHLPLIPCAL